MALQGILLLAVAAGGLAGPAWAGAARLVTVVIGTALMVGGGWLAVRGIVDLRENLTVWPHPREGNRLVESGVYGLVRHPIYGGQLIGSLGWALVMASPATALATLLLGLLYLAKSTREERWLVERHVTYVAYRERTRRFIPWVL